MEWHPCPACGKSHPWRPGTRTCPIIKVAKVTRPAKMPKARVEARTAKAGTFDRNAYHREYMRGYMRRYRMKAKANASR